MAKILVVDDVDVERMAIVEILKKAGHVVVEAADGEQGVEQAKAQRPDLIFMDIVMPKLDGFAATKRLMMSPDTKAIPVVIVSSKSQESDKFRAKQLGAKGYLTKPARAAEILPLVKQIL